MRNVSRIQIKRADFETENKNFADDPATKAFQNYQNLLQLQIDQGMAGNFTAETLKDHYDD